MSGRAVLAGYARQRARLAGRPDVEGDGTPPPPPDTLTTEDGAPLTTEAGVALTEE